MDAFALARIQFAANITFHIVFPTITIALAWILLFFKLAYHRTQNMKWMEAYQFWVKIFAMCFAIGVVSGITMSFQFGTNWPGFMQTVGNIAGPLLAYEVLTAFFLEATFLGIMLFGFRRVSARLHTIATFLVAFGTLLSVFFILALNSWMQTPAGFEMREGVAYATDWTAIIFSPSMPYRVMHMLLASGLTAAFLVAGISAYRWLLNDRRPAVMAALKTGVYLGAILIPLQIVMGDLHGLNTLKHQPAKIAAIEAVWDTEKGAPLLLFALPDAETRSNRFAIGIPKLASLVLTHSWDGEVKGLNSFEGEHPPVAPLFFGFRLMVGIGVLMLACSWLGSWFLYRQTLPHWLAKTLVAMSFSGCIATVAGWYVTEIGRQPWLVYGVLSTKNAVAHNVSDVMIGSTLAMYLSLYAVLIVTFITVIFYLARQATKKGDKEATQVIPVSPIESIPLTER
ncbi:MAG: cytochrome bd ubiquinol oxidase, subunit [Pseudomonadota bacterium]|jgi:cytochrome d ubiquinol oxidase subunit I